CGLWPVGAAVTRQAAILAAARRHVRAGHSGSAALAAGRQWRQIRRVRNNGSPGTPAGPIGGGYGSSAKKWH
ncbi:unnamed protein product, partial [Urochloa humidicola]